MRTRTIAALILAPVMIAACSDDPTGPEEFDTEDLTAELVVTPAHFHTWETEGTFTVSVVDPDDDSVTDFTAIRVERRLVGATNWGNIALTKEGNFYVGTYTFGSSGSYELRVTGQRASDTEMKVLYTASALLEVVPAHSTLGGYTVSFEVFPGHIHRNDTPTFTWWFEAAGAHVSPVEAPPSTPPSMSVTCPTGTLTSDLEEAIAGQWEADITLLHIGACTAAIAFTGVDAAQHTYSVPIAISEAH